MNWIIYNNFVSGFVCSWFTVSFHMPNGDFENPIIWHNFLLKVDKRIIFSCFMFQKGVHYVEDFLNCDASATPCKVLFHKFNLFKSPFTLYREAFLGLSHLNVRYLLSILLIPTFFLMNVFILTFQSVQTLKIYLQDQYFSKPRQFKM